MADKKIVVCDYCGEQTETPIRVRVFLSRQYDGVESFNTFYHIDFCPQCAQPAMQDVLTAFEKLDHDAAIKWATKHRKDKSILPRG